MASDTPLIELKGIKKYYPLPSGFFGEKSGIVKAVDGVDLIMAKAESYGLVGESGCGKTTLSRILIKLIDSDEGSIIIKGSDVTRLSPKDFRHHRCFVQMVFQDPYSSLDPRWTIGQILEEPMGLDPKRFSLPKVRQTRIAEMIQAVQLPSDILSRYPHEFSGGERQRIAIARALMTNPELLILDEAVSSLDVLVQDQILKLLQDLQKRFSLSYLFITHNLKVVQRICHRVSVMYKGRIVESGLIKDVFNNAQHAYTQALLKASLEYKVGVGQANWDIQSNLIDLGQGHYVRKG